MTRINLGIHPEELCDQHLRAEYRELPRIYTMVRKTIEAGSPLNIPPTFRLGEGHMLFFADRGIWLRRRWLSLKDELISRGFNPQLRWRPYPMRYGGRNLRRDITSDEYHKARPLLIARIRERFALGRPKNPTWSKGCPDWARDLIKIKS